MINIAHLTTKMQTVFETKANQMAWKTGFMERERVLTGSSFLTGLVSAWQANPDVSLAGLSQAIGNAGTPISRQGVNQRFNAKTVTFLQAMVQVSLETLLADNPVETEILNRFSAVELTDSSVITLPNSLTDVWRGSGGFGEEASTSALKLSVRWDMVSGQITELDIGNGTDHDRTFRAHHAPVRPNSLQIRDLGYFKLADLHRTGQQGAFWLTRYKQGTHLLTTNDELIDLQTWLPRQVGDRLDTQVRVGKLSQLPARLVAERVPQSVVSQRHERIRETARQNQKPPSPRALELAHWTIYLTNVPASRLTPDDVFLMGRYRWQIELLFKLWKSELHIDKWNTRNPYRILCELYAKLIVAITTHWLLLVSCWDNPRRSFTQAMPTIRGLAWQWANSLSDSHLLAHFFDVLERALSRCQMDAVQANPRHFQLLHQLSA